MLCPVCKETSLVMAERQSIEIDYCPQCRGVWLDRGELDKIIERSERETTAAVPAQPVPGTPPQPSATYPAQPQMAYPPPQQYGESSFGHGGGHQNAGHCNSQGGRHGGFLKRLFD